MKTDYTKELTSLGKSGAKFEGLETFPKPPNVFHVVCVTDEVTAVCPKTGQPDQYTVEIDYEPERRCVESKTLKLYLQKYRNEGHFCEAFADIIARDIDAALKPKSVIVRITQKPRGGISIIASAMRGKR
jgi:7-cyano-7-deazaguanine reductase